MVNKLFALWIGSYIDEYSIVTSLSPDLQSLAHWNVLLLI